MQARNASLLQFFVFSCLLVVGVHDANARGWHRSSWSGGSWSGGSYALSVDYVNWYESHQQLTIIGKGEPGSLVYLYGGDTDYLLASLSIRKTGRWYYKISSPSSVPCSVRAESNGSVAEQETVPAPPNCMSTVISSDGSAVSSVDLPAINNPPEISGSPSTSVDEGTLYKFVPSAFDPDGDTLSFSITNLPAWASFSSITGTLSGTPRATDVGLYEKIVIAASDGTATATLDPVTITVNAATAAPTGSATLSWVAPVSRVDGTPLALSQIGGYKIYMGVAPDNLTVLVNIHDGSAVEYLVNDLSAGIYYFGLTTYDTAGVESQLSDLVQKLIM